MAYSARFIKKRTHQQNRRSAVFFRTKKQAHIHTEMKDASLKQRD
ncbi:hypothetical protein B4125_1608 [Bacillus paralicheniformis]|nr:hypothetical protein SC10_B2orf03088 [Bacillus paralicheniformis]OLG07427.1 hypothetical protein B4125_1608 [Bacillus paralicheniformis]TWJ62234.1 hypothetical protein CHCC5021_1701 [Bacillus paralicheniformis]TWK41599.1 hypothetical protein CHCC20347_0200 [Bacillus paralicheniformis]TWK83859.1 hypothetical protein CHCC20331_0271 [Bacillus paralicheniformis]